MKPAIAAWRRSELGDLMKKRSFSTAGLTRRGFLGAGSTGLAFLSLPGPATPLSWSSPADIDASGAESPLFLARDGRPSSSLIVPSDPGVLSRMAERAISASVKRQTGVTLDSLKASRGFPQFAHGNLFVLGTPEN